MTRVIYTDGSGTSRGTSAYCIILEKWGVFDPNSYNYRTGKSKEQKKIIKIIQREMNVYEIEYLALLEAIKLIPMDIFGNDKGHDYIIYMDNLQIVREINGDLRALSHTEPINKIKNMIEARKNKISVQWVPRDKNLAGIYLEKRLDKINRYLKQITRPRRYK